MKNRTVVAIATAAFVAGAAIPTIAYERHPDIRAGINNLVQARNVLNQGTHDFHGYRVKAIGEINQAIGDLNMALRSDHG